MHQAAWRQHLRLGIQCAVVDPQVGDLARTHANKKAGQPAGSGAAILKTKRLGQPADVDAKFISNVENGSHEPMGQDR
jgi:hypothetical protein